MIISENMLLSSGAETKFYKKKDFIFEERGQPKYYYQILEGTVTLCNYQEDGQAFIQNFFNEGDSIHESSLFEQSKYKVNAVAITDCIIYRLEKLRFFELMDANSPIKDLMYINSTNAIKFLMAKNIFFKNPVQKMLHIIDL